MAGESDASEASARKRRAKRSRFCAQSSDESNPAHARDDGYAEGLCGGEYVLVRPLELFLRRRLERGEPVVCEGRSSTSCSLASSATRSTFRIERTGARCSSAERRLDAREPSFAAFSIAATSPVTNPSFTWLAPAWLPALGRPIRRLAPRSRRACPRCSWVRGPRLTSGTCRRPPRSSPPACTGQSEPNRTLSAPNHSSARSTYGASSSCVHFSQSASVTSPDSLTATFGSALYTLHPGGPLPVVAVQDRGLRQVVDDERHFAVALDGRDGCGQLAHERGDRTRAPPRPPWRLLAGRRRGAATRDRARRGPGGGCRRASPPGIENSESSVASTSGAVRSIQPTIPSTNRAQTRA